MEQNESYAKYHGTKTEQNLQTALAGESVACVKYRLYAERAKKDGYEQIAEKFLTLAENEQRHAEVWLTRLLGISDTRENLIAAAGNEHHEWAEMYPTFAKDAEAEGYKDLEALFMLVADVESRHEAALNEYVNQTEDNSVFSKQEEVTWVCRVCGFTVNGKIAPKRCPICGRPVAYFETVK